MSKKMRKFAGGGAMGAASAMKQSLNELGNSLDGIQDNLGSGGGGPRPQPIPDNFNQNDESRILKIFGPQGQQDTATNMQNLGLKKGGSVGSASKRADGCAVKGKTKGRVI
jgi:hypothetical protein